MLTARSDLKTPREGDRSIWHASQATYWESVAQHYNSYYTGAWAQLENSIVERRLRFIASMPRPTVVDLACGTGLGRDIVTRINPSSRYLGIDISRPMLNGAPPELPRVVAAMDQAPVRSATADAVLVLFTSSSFSYDLASLFSEVHRLLKPGALAYLSLLSQTALSRLMVPANWNGHYRTRGDRGSLAAPVNRSTPRKVLALVTSAGLEVLHIEALNALSGIAESRVLWKPGRLLGWIAPNLSHSLEVTVRKPAGGGE